MFCHIPVICPSTQLPCDFSIHPGNETRASEWLSFISNTFFKKFHYIIIFLCFPAIQQFFFQFLTSFGVLLKQFSFLSSTNYFTTEITWSWKLSKTILLGGLVKLRLVVWMLWYCKFRHKRLKSSANQSLPVRRQSSHIVDNCWPVCVSVPSIHKDVVQEDVHLILLVLRHCTARQNVTTFSLQVIAINEYTKHKNCSGPRPLELEQFT